MYIGVCCINWVCVGVCDVCGVCGMIRCRPEVRLCGHTEEGYGLCWNPLQEGVLVSASNDGNICMWNVEAKTENKSISAPLVLVF